MICKCFPPILSVVSHFLDDGLHGFWWEIRGSSCWGSLLHKESLFSHCFQDSLSFSSLIIMCINVGVFSIKIEFHPHFNYTTGIKLFCWYFYTLFFTCSCYLISHFRVLLVTLKCLELRSLRALQLRSRLFLAILMEGFSRTLVF